MRLSRFKWSGIAMTLFLLLAGMMVRGGDEEINILFLGDTSFGDTYAKRMQERGIHYPILENGYEWSLQNFLPVLKKADFTVLNLETVLVNQEKSASSLKAKPKNILHWDDPEKIGGLLKEVGVDAVSLANNHGMDYGEEGLKSTIRELESRGIGHFGAGMERDAARECFFRDFGNKRSPFRLQLFGGYWYKERYHKKYRFYAGKERPGVNRFRVGKTRYWVEKMRTQDSTAFLVTFPHFGTNYTFSNKEQRAIAHEMIEGGADLVIGHGAHMMQEVERYKGKWIIYGLGNFVMNSPGRYHKAGQPYSSLGMLNIKPLNEGKWALTFRLYPVYCDNLKTDFQPRFVNLVQMKQLRDNLTSTGTGPGPDDPAMRILKDEIGYHFQIDLGNYARP